MDTLAIITVIGGIALLVALFGGGIKAKEIEIPSIPGILRIVSGITGIILIGMALRLSFPNPVTPPAIQPTTSSALVQSSEPTTQPVAQPTAEPTQPIAQSAAPTTEPIAQPDRGDVLFFEDFEDGKANDFRFFEEDWHVIQDGSDNTVLETKSSGDTPTGWTQADFGPTTLGDYSIECRVRLIEYDTAEGTYSGLTSLVFRQGSPGAYAFALNPYQHQIELNHITPDGGWGPIEEGQGVGAYDLQKNIWYVMRVEVYGTQIKAYLDGQLVFTFEDSRLKEGGLAFLRAPKTIVQFDDVRVTK